MFLPRGGAPARPDRRRRLVRGVLGAGLALSFAATCLIEGPADRPRSSCWGGSGQVSALHTVAEGLRRVGRLLSRRLAAAGRPAARLRREPRAGRRPRCHGARRGTRRGRPVAGPGARCRRSCCSSTGTADWWAALGHPRVREPLRRDAAGPRGALGPEPGGSVRYARLVLCAVGGRTGRVRALPGGAAVAGRPGRRDGAGAAAQRRAAGSRSACLTPARCSPTARGRSTRWRPCPRCTRPSRC